MNVIASHERLPVPEDLQQSELALWMAIVNSLPAGYFRPSDLPLLKGFCAAANLHTQALAAVSRDGLLITTPQGRKRANPAVAILAAQTRAMANIAQKLRLCPSARYTPTKAATLTGKGNNGGKPKPWDTTPGPHGG